VTPVTTYPILRQIRENGRTLIWIAGELQMEPSLLRKKLIGQRRPFTEAQARHIRALTGLALADIPHIPEQKETAA
jgi:hypothetical protein